MSNFDREMTRKLVNQILENCFSASTRINLWSALRNKWFSLKKYRIRNRIACQSKRTKITTIYQSIAFGPFNFEKFLSR